MSDASDTPAPAQPSAPSPNPSAMTEPKPRGCLHALSREILVPLGMALVFILFVIQAFKIPSASMADSLLVGDFLLGLKAPYGAPIPFTDARTPAFTDPKPGDILIFKYPGDPDVPGNDPQRYRFVVNLLFFGALFYDKQAGEGESAWVIYQRKDFIKRCVAQSGQTVVVDGPTLALDGKSAALPRHGKYDPQRGFDEVRDKLTFRLPMPGETYRFDTLSLHHAMWIRSLAMQENPGRKVELLLDLVKDSVVDNDYVLPYLNGDPMDRHHLSLFGLLQIRAMRMQSEGVQFLHAEQVPFSMLRDAAKTGFVRSTPLVFPDGQSGMFRTETSEYLLPPYFHLVEQNLMGQSQALGVSLKMRPSLAIDGEVQSQYTVKKTCYFMMGDNRDNSSDSRYWGLLSRDFVKAKASIIYFSFDNEDDAFALTNPLTWFRIPFRIRYSRVGKLIE
jgi:signal peptidase I